ncbi:hypothetical protein BURKHO8Y_520154 [Burkholderia sp. 8Y]|nr:hypothetical protein BURKHO8Y_520154 [Burkholderia sp. 8Y]
MTSRAFGFLKCVTRSGLIFIASVAGGVWLSRAIVIRQGEMPHWMEVSARHLLAAFGNQDPPIEDIIDTSVFVIFSLCSILVGALLIATLRSLKRWRAARNTR